MSSTTLSATITDSTGQVWANGSYQITFAPNPNLPSAPYQWNDAPFIPQVYAGVLDGSGSFTVTLPDSNTITPAGSQWNFVLCPNATAVCTQVVTPVTGSTQDLSALFSARVIPPTIFASPMPRAYSTNEVAVPPPLQGGQFYRVTDNVPLFWTGTMWKALGGTVQSIGLTMPSIFTVSGSPVTSTGTIGVTLNAEAALTVFGNPSGSSAVPSFNTLNAAQIAAAGTLSNNTTGNADTSTIASGIVGGYVSQITAGTAIGVSPGGGQGNVTVSNTGVTAITAGTGITTSGSTGNVTVNAPPPTFTGTSGHQTLPSGLILQWGHDAVADGSPGTAITFPVAFPNACFVVTVTDDFARNASTIMSVQNGTITTTGFTARADNPSSGAFWLAVGY